MIILVDVDSTIADLVPEWLRIYNKIYNDNLTIDDITSWAIHKFAKPECGDKIYDILRMDTLYESVRPIEGAFEEMPHFK
jgi:5'-nucleotidase